MTQRAGTPPDGGAARLLIGLPLGVLIAFAIASMDHPYIRNLLRVDWGAALSVDAGFQ